MVGARTISASSPSSPPQPGRDSSASFSSFRCFGACMQGWYHRCIGLDP